MQEKSLKEQSCMKKQTESKNTLKLNIIKCKEKEKKDV